MFGNRSLDQKTCQNCAHSYEVRVDDSYVDENKQVWQKCYRGLYCVRMKENQIPDEIWRDLGETCNRDRWRMENGKELPNFTICELFSEKGTPLWGM